MKTILTIFIFLLSENIFSCDCPINTIEKTIIETELILRGEFIEVKNNPFPILSNESEKQRLYFEGKIIILEVLKGIGIKAGDTILVESDYSDCSQYYKMSSNYLFFASRFNAGIKSDDCSFTTELIDVTKNELYASVKNLLK